MNKSGTEIHEIGRTPISFFLLFLLFDAPLGQKGGGPDHQNPKHRLFISSTYPILNTMIRGKGKETRIGIAVA